MATFIILLIIFFILWPLLRVLFRIFRAGYQMKRQFNQFAKQANAAGYGSRDAYDDEEEYYTPQHKKRFKSSDGEYVEFEELKEERETEIYQETVKPYPLIEDAKYEDIK